MIIYTEKGAKLHELIYDAGHTLTQVNGVWESSNDIAVQAIIDDYDPLPDAQTNAIAQINAKADDLITAKLPLLKQTDLIAIALTLIAKPVRGLGDLTQAELDTLTVIEQSYAYPIAIRAQADIEEAKILAETDWTLCVTDFTAMESIV